MIEEKHEKNAHGETDGFSVGWWDAKAQGQRFVWCANDVPEGCVVPKDVAKWVGERLVFSEEREEAGRKVTHAEIFSDITPTSFTQILQEGEPGHELKPTITIRATRTDDAGASSDDVIAEGATLDRRLTDIYLHRDWPALAAIVAPDYYGTGEGFEWDFAALQREFPKIQLSELHVERQHVKRLAPDLIVVNDILTMRETYGNQNISGRYWSGDIWVKRDGRWLLLVEQEIPLK